MQHLDILTTLGHPVFNQQLNLLNTLAAAHYPNASDLSTASNPHVYLQTGYLPNFPLPYAVYSFCNSFAIVCN